MSTLEITITPKGKTKIDTVFAKFITAVAADNDGKFRVGKISCYSSKVDKDEEVNRIFSNDEGGWYPDKPCIYLNVPLDNNGGIAWAELTSTKDEVEKFLLDACSKTPGLRNANIDYWIY